MSKSASKRLATKSMSATVKDVETVQTSIKRPITASAGSKKALANDEACSDHTDHNKDDPEEPERAIPEVYKTQGTASYTNCAGYSESTCLCSSFEEGSASTTNKRISYMDRRNWITTERLCELRKKAQEAIKQHKTFTIRGCFYSIRKGLVERGWVEKLDIHRRAPVNGSCQIVLEEVTQNLPSRRPGETRRQHIQKCERNIMSRFLEHIPIDFLWSARREKTDWIDMARNSGLMVNKFHKSPFTTKEGLCTVLRDLHWFTEEGKSETYYPRSYNVWSQEDLTEFSDDYRLTACISTLRFMSETKSKNGVNALVDTKGQIPMSCVRFAITQCQNYIKTCLHYDIDEDIERVWDHEWEVFLTHYQMLTQENAKILEVVDDPFEGIVGEIDAVLGEVSAYWSQYNLDGVLNIWIVKPSNRCRGRGIHLMNDIKKIVSFVNPPVVNKGRYVVQKYIERPLIIHNCKFDIRQWFLVTSVQPLVIWMYKESYLRFSSQEYDLVNFHESVHLTNHAIQKRYKNGKRDERLPRENMWDCHTFQAYLRQIGKANMWSERIYPGMQRALVGTMLASQDTMDRRSNTFELFGADFMVSEDCQPWLIEINASPDLGASTSVTARLCPEMLEDAIKVVIDYRSDPKNSTGNFELIYRQVIPPAPAYLGLNLFLKGTQIFPKNGAGKREKLRDGPKSRSDLRSSSSRDGAIPETIATSKPYVIDLIDCITNTARAGSIKSPRKSVKLRGLAMRKQSKVEEIESPRLIVEKSEIRHLAAISECINRKPVSKPGDSARRHTSCGPRLMTVIQSDDNQNVEINNNNPAGELKCIGNKCCGESPKESSNLPVILKQRLRKQSLETPRLNASKSRLKPLSIVEANANANSQSFSKSRPIKFLSGNNKDYRKYISSTLQLNKLPSKPVNDGYCSHFFAVGLSLRAWRSKYNRIIKFQKDSNDVPLAQGFASMSSRKPKNHSQNCHKELKPLG